ncbi:MAG: SURF1 family protein [Pseudomonadota bacterium]|nr:SURF1 family protein [Pseudomonadota bacterium]
MSGTGARSGTPARAARTTRNLLVGWTLALLVIALFARLGFWQLDRAEQKRETLMAAAQALEPGRVVSLAAAADAARKDSYDWALGTGRFAPTGPLLLDNQQRGGSSGVRAYRVFEPAQGPALLVDLGWLPLGGARELPEVERPQGDLELRGLLAPPPSAGLAMGAPMARVEQGWLMTRVESAAIVEALGLDGPLAPRVLRLDPALRLGYERDLDVLPNTLTPDKHRGYALQWFGLAIALLVIALVLTFRRFDHER